MYDAVLGKFFSEDPIRTVAGDANLYRYVKNDPVNQVDPSGLEPPSLGPNAIGCKIGPDSAKQYAEFSDFLLDKNQKISEIDFNKIPKANIDKLLEDERIKKEVEVIPQKDRPGIVVVTPMLVGGRIVRAVFVQNSEVVVEGGDCDTDTRRPGVPSMSSLPKARIVALPSFRYVGAGPSSIGAKALAENLHSKAGELSHSKMMVELLASYLHFVPFGTAADYAKGDAKSPDELPVGGWETLLVTVGDLTLVGGWYLNTTGKGGKAIVEASLATKLAWGAAIADAGTTTIQAGMAIGNAWNDPKGMNIAIAAALATAAIFGVTAQVTRKKPPHAPDLDSPNPKPSSVAEGAANTPLPPKPIPPLTNVTETVLKPTNQGTRIGIRAAEGGIDAVISGSDLFIEFYQVSKAGGNYGTALVQSALDLAAKQGKTIKSISATLGGTNDTIFKACGDIWKTPLGQSMLQLDFKNVVQDGATWIFKK